VSEMKHTPGPWEIGDLYGEDALLSASGEAVAYAVWDGGSGCHLEFGNPADVCLITAAPDLLAELTRRHDHEIDQGHRCDEFCHAAVVIAKATGEQA